MGIIIFIICIIGFLAYLVCETNILSYLFTGIAIIIIFSFLVSYIKSKLNLSNSEKSHENSSNDYERCRTKAGYYYTVKKSSKGTIARKITDGVDFINNIAAISLLLVIFGIGLFFVIGLFCISFYAGVVALIALLSVIGIMLKG